MISEFAGDRQRRNLGLKLKPLVMFGIRIWSAFWDTVWKGYIG